MTTSLTLTPLPDDGAIRVRVERDDSDLTPVVDYAATSQTASDSELAKWNVRNNLVANPSFETNLDGWETALGTSTRTSSYGDTMWPALGYRSGGWMLQAVANGTNASMSVSQTSGSAIPVTPGQWIAVSMLVASDIPAPGRARMQVVFYGSATTTSPEPVNDPSLFYAGRLAVYAFQVPATATTARIGVVGYSGSSALLPNTRRIWMDDVRAATSSSEAGALAKVAPFYPGSSSADDERVELWMNPGDTAERVMTGLTIGQRYLVELSKVYTTIDTQVTVSDTAVSFTMRYPMTYRVEFTATSTTHILAARNLSSSTNTLAFEALKVSPRAAPQVILGPNFASGGDSVWTGTAKTGTSYSMAMSFYGVLPQYYLSMYYDITTGTSVTMTPQTMVSRNITGLTIGQTYRLTINASGTYMNSVAATVSTNFYWRAGVVGKGYGNTALGLGVSVLEFTATATTHNVTVGNALVFQAFATSFYDVYMRTHQMILEAVPNPLDNAYSIANLMRTDANGTREVRLPPGLPLLSSGVYTVDDFEHSLIGNVKYTAVVTTPGGADQTGSKMVNVDGLWTDSFIAPAVLPRLGSSARIVESYGAESPTSSVIHDVIGRRDPLVAIGIQRLRRGTMRVWATDYAHAQDIVQTAGRGHILFWRQPDHPGLDMYFVAGAANVGPYDARTETRRWFVDLPYTEVKSPDSPLLGTIAWNFAASTDRNGTFFDSLDEFTTFADLLIGPGE